MRGFFLASNVATGGFETHYDAKQNRNDKPFTNRDDIGKANYMRGLCIDSELITLDSDWPVLARSA